MMVIISIATNPHDLGQRTQRKGRHPHQWKSHKNTSCTSLRFQPPALSLANIWLRHHDRTSISLISFRWRKTLLLCLRPYHIFHRHTHHLWLTNGQLPTCRLAGWLPANDSFFIRFPANVCETCNKHNKWFRSCATRSPEQAVNDCLMETWRMIWDDLNNSFAVF